jgi:hypothetical protein
MYSLASFESRDDRRHPSGNSNNVPRQGGRSGNHYNQQETPKNVDGGYNDGKIVKILLPSLLLFLEYHTERNRHPSGSGKTNERRHSQSQRLKTPPRHASDDDVFIVPDTPTSNEDGVDQGSTTIARQASRNWADCPIDESVTEPSPPPSANNTLTGDDFQVRIFFRFTKQVKKYSHRLFVIKIPNPVRINNHHRVKWVINPFVVVTMEIIIVEEHHKYQVDVVIMNNFHRNI